MAPQRPSLSGAFGAFPGIVLGGLRLESAWVRLPALATNGGRDREACDRRGASREGQRSARGALPGRCSRSLDESRARARRRDRAGSDVSGHDGADEPRREGALRDRRVRRLRAADRRRADRRRTHGRGRGRQDLRGAARASGAHPDGRHGHAGGDAGGFPVSAQVLAAAGAVDTGDTAWMLVATALVLMMTPALGLFYAGLVRAKNPLNTFMMCLAAIAVATVTW